MAKQLTHWNAAYDALEIWYKAPKSNTIVACYATWLNGQGISKVAFNAFDTQV